MRAERLGFSHSHSSDRLVAHMHLAISLNTSRPFPCALPLHFCSPSITREALRDGHCNMAADKGQLLLCAGCKLEYYCNSECQSNAWLKHKVKCKRVQEKGRMNERVFMQVLSQTAETTSHSSPQEYNSGLQTSFASPATTQPISPVNRTPLDESTNHMLG